MSEWWSPTYGTLSWEEVRSRLQTLIMDNPHETIEVLVGTDSQNHRSRTTMVSSVVIRFVGHGARFFVHKQEMTILSVLANRMATEVSESLQVATQVTEAMAEIGWSAPIKVHIDIGEIGKTHTLIRELTGMVRGSHYIPVIKPDSVAASSLADRFTK